MNRYRRTLTAGTGAAMVFASVTLSASFPAQTVSASAEFMGNPSGVMDNSAPGDHKVTDAIAEREMAFRDWVRQMRIDRQGQRPTQPLSP